MSCIFGDLGVADDCVQTFRSSTSSLLFRFLTKKMHENIPTVRISNAAAAIVMPAICAIVRFSFPDTETPSGPALTEAWVIATVDGGEVVVELVVAGTAEERGFVVVLGCRVELVV